MISIVFAERFIQKIKEYTNYNFLVFDINGMIIAATEKERVGVFHEASYYMMKNKLDMIVINPYDTDNYLGVKPGIDMPIIHNNITVGAIGITGVPSEVKEIITISKMTIEAMLDYEFYKEETTKINNKKELFVKYLTDDNLKSLTKLTELCVELGYDPNSVRLSFLFDLKTENEASFVSDLEKSNLVSHQDIYFFTKNHEFIIFKNCPVERTKILEKAKETACNFIKQFKAEFEKYKIEDFYVGSFQNKLKYYLFAYHHCLWMKAMKHTNKFFYDFTYLYIQSKIPSLEIEGIMNTLDILIEDSIKETFSEMFEALSINNYNLVETSQQMFIHKNTLIYRLNKLRAATNRNPLNNANDRFFFELFKYYLDKK